MEVAAASCLGATEATAAVERLAAKAALSTMAARSSSDERKTASIMPRQPRVAPSTKASDQRSTAFSLASLVPDLVDASDRKPRGDVASELRIRPPGAPVGPVDRSAEDGAAPGEDQQVFIPKKKVQPDKGVAAKTRARPDPASREVTIKPALATDTHETKSGDEIYLHLKNEDDRAAAETLGDVLKGKGYQVRAIQIVEGAMTTGDVRYHRQDQEKSADSIRSIVETYLRDDLSIEDLKLQVVYIGDLYPNLSKNKIEIWMPQLKNG
jgi:hypothetical protein